MDKGRTAAGQAGYQLAALGVTIAMAIVGGAVTGKSLGGGDWVFGGEAYYLGDYIFYFSN